MIGEHFYAFVSSPQHVCETLNFTFVRIDTAIGLRAVEVSPESQNNRNPAGFEDCGRWGFRHPCCSGADYPSRQLPGSRSGHGESLAQLNPMSLCLGCLKHHLNSPAQISSFEMYRSWKPVDCSLSRCIAEIDFGASSAQSP